MVRDYICEYSHAPRSDRLKSCMLVSGCIAAAVGMLAVAETGWILAPYFRCGAFVWILAGALFGARLLSTGYVYSIFRDIGSGEVDLVINELRFGRSKNVCRVGLFDISKIEIYDPAAVISAARREGKKRIKRIKRPRPRRLGERAFKSYNYCVDVLPAHYCLVWISGSEDACVKFSPDDAILEIIKKYV